MRHTIEVDLALKVRVMEHLHGDFFFAMVKRLELRVVDSDVLRDFL